MTIYDFAKEAKQRINIAEQYLNNVSKAGSESQKKYIRERALSARNNIDQLIKPVDETPPGTFPVIKYTQEDIQKAIEREQNVVLKLVADVTNKTEYIYDTFTTGVVDPKLSIENKRLSAENLKLTKDLKTAEALLATMRTSYKQIEAKLELKEQEVKNLEAKLAALGANNVTLQSNITTLNATIAALTTQLSAKQAEISKLESKVSALENKLTLDALAHQAEIEKLKKQYAADLAIELKALETKMQTTILNLTQKIADIEGKLQASTAEIEKLNQTIQEYELGKTSLESEIARLKAELAKTIKKRDETIQKMTAKIKELSRRINAATTTTSVKPITTSLGTSTTSLGSSTVTSTTSTNAPTMTSTATSTTSDAPTMTSTATSTTSDAPTMTSTATSTTSDAPTMTSISASALQKPNLTSSRVNSTSIAPSTPRLETSNNIINQENQLSVDNSLLQAELDGLRALNKHYGDDIKKKDELIESLQNQLRKLSADLIKKDQTIQTMQDRINVLTIIANEYEDAKIQMNRKIRSMQEDFDRQKKELEKEYNIKNDELREKERSLEAKMNHYKHSIREEYELKVKEIENEKSDIAQRLKELKTKHTNLQQKNLEMNTEIEALKGQLDKKEEEIYLIKNELTKEKSKFNRQMDRYNTLKELHKSILLYMKYADLFIQPPGDIDKLANDLETSYENLGLKPYTEISRIQDNNAKLSLENKKLTKENEELVQFLNFAKEQIENGSTNLYEDSEEVENEDGEKGNKYSKPDSLKTDDTKGRGRNIDINPIIPSLNLNSISPDSQGQSTGKRDVTGGAELFLGGAVYTASLGYFYIVLLLTLVVLVLIYYLNVKECNNIFTSVCYGY